MSGDPILFLGGSGAIGHQTARALRELYPSVSLLIGGRNLAKAQDAALQIGNARGVQIDPAADDLGLGDQSVSAIVVFYMDHTLAGLRYAQRCGLPHLSISSGVFEIAPEIATFMQCPHASAVVLGYEWMVGATTVSTLHLAQAFSRVQAIRVHALADEQDAGGPTVAADFEHLNRMLPAAMTRRDGAYTWRGGESAKVVFRAVDGTPIDATGFSSIDVAGLAAATGATDVQFNLAIGVRSTRRQGGLMSTEIILELEGKDHQGELLSTRHAVIHPAGAAALTGLSVALLLERLLGLDGNAPTPAGLYFPYQILDFDRYLRCLKREGGQLQELELHPKV